MARIVGLLLVLIVAVGCANQTLTPTSALPTPPITPPTAPTPRQTLAIEHPTGATDIVLRMAISGGLRYPGATVESPPAFTLYGDGRVIYSIQRPRPDGSTLTELRQARLTEEQIATMVENALGPGGLAAARVWYADVPIADDVTTNFEVHAGGVDKTVAVYALGYSEEGMPDAAARLAFEGLAQALRGFGAEVAAGNAEDLGPFEPQAYRVTLDDPFGPMEANREWPWQDLEPADFQLDNSGFRTRILTAEQATAISDPPMSAPDGVVVRAPDGAEYLVRLLALLPDQLP